MHIRSAFAERILLPEHSFRSVKSTIDNGTMSCLTPCFLLVIMKKIIVTTQNLRTITGYAARCRNHQVFVVQPERRRIISCEAFGLARDETWFEIQPKQPHPFDSMDVLITAGMGSALLAELTSRGIEGLITTEKDPKLAVKMYLQGTLPLAEIEEYFDTEDYIEDLSRLPSEVRNKCCGNTSVNGGCCGRGLRGLV